MYRPEVPKYIDVEEKSYCKIATKSRKEKTKLTTKERIAAIKLYEKAEKHMQYAKRIGIEIAEKPMKGERSDEEDHMYKERRFS